MTDLKKIFALIVFAAGIFSVQASYLDDIGVTLLRATTTNLNGSGIRVGQAEAQADVNVWEVNPFAVNEPTNFFYYYFGTSPYLTISVTNTYPNSLGLESGHADAVAANFYGLTTGVATNVLAADNYEAETFINYYVNNGRAIPNKIVNQSYIMGYVTNGTPANQYFITVSQQQSYDSLFDNYVTQNKTLFISGIGNGGAVDPPATCYNGIGAGAFRGGSSIGPTLDNGRCKPDIVAPETETSYSTPEIAGVATILMQAGLRGDGGSDTNSATDIRTLKALLLNGAVKPMNWTNSNSSPLDARYGAGVVNVFNSYKQLCGGKRNWNFSTNVPSGTAHFPVVSTNSISVLNAWDFNTNASSAGADGVKHYFFNVTNAMPSALFCLTATLAWNKEQAGLNNLNLFLYDCANSNLVACSTSAVDNVEHIFVPQLAQGRYDLQVWKAATANALLLSEPYALAWGFSSPALEATKSGTNLNLSWPIYPAGFAVAATANLSAPNWSTNNLPSPVWTNGQNVISVPATNAVEFFRLQMPNF